MVDPLGFARALRLRFARKSSRELSMQMADLIAQNFGDFRALPRREICRWNDSLLGEPSVFDSGYSPTVANPLVYHLHGHIALPESLVLTEDDYLDFLVKTSAEPDLIPPRVQKSFADTTLLFIGYRLGDLDFRVLLRSLASHLTRQPRRAHVSVQLITTGNMISQAQIQSAQEYLGDYCKELDIGVYWGKSRDFLAELRQRWQAFTRESQA